MFERLISKVWLLTTITLLFAAFAISIAWEASRSGSSVVIATLGTLVALGVYALILYLAIKPNRNKFRILPVKISFTTIITAGLIVGIVHFYRFVPSPEATSALPYSVIAAVLFLLAGISVYLQVLLFIWKARGN